jgi:hypothetical protein
MRFTSNSVFNVSSSTIYMKTRMIVNPSFNAVFLQLTIYTTFRC